MEGRPNVNKNLMTMVPQPQLLEETTELTPGVDFDDFSQMDMSHQFINDSLNESSVIRQSNQESYFDNVKSFENKKERFYQ